MIKWVIGLAFIGCLGIGQTVLNKFQTPKDIEVKSITYLEGGNRLYIDAPVVEPINTFDIDRVFDYVIYTTDEGDVKIRTEDGRVFKFVKVEEDGQ